jgi:hypothetical protein
MRTKFLSTAHEAKEDHLRDLCTNGRVILRQILRKKYEDLDWIHVALDMVQWQALLNMVMNIQVP